MGHPELDVIDELAKRGLFRERELTHRKINIDWLGAEAQEPASLWIAIANKSRPPRSLDVSMIIRTSNLERQLTSHRPKGRLITLRVHDRERARADVERADLPRLLQRAADRYRFVVPDDACFLSAALPAVRWRPREDWVTERSIDPTRILITGTRSAAPRPAPARQ
ncbi:MAG: hypothetical protein Q8L48_31600 [Archangium sp.]|nr:hypothetical protein [Archangium sp.]